MLKSSFEPGDVIVDGAERIVVACVDDPCATAYWWMRLIDTSLALWDVGVVSAASEYERCEDGKWRPIQAR